MKEIKSFKYRIYSLLSQSIACCFKIIDPLTCFCRRLSSLAFLKSRTEGEIAPSTQFDGAVRARNKTKLKIEDHCRIGEDVYFESEGGGSIHLGRHVRINQGCVLTAHAKIEIGAHSLVGEYVSIRDANHKIEGDVLIRESGHIAKPIVIGENVWIGRGCMILPGTQIGNGAVIGANSVVRGEIPARAIAVGAPAKVISERGDLNS